MKQFAIYVTGILFLTTLMGCEGFFGVKTSTDFLDEPQFDQREVAYVPIQPVWDDMEYPVDIIAGWDELIYVADSVSEEIISFDQAGNELGRYSVPGLSSIAQDRSLDILAVGTFDTTINNRDFTLSTIYRIDLNKGGDYGLENAFIENKIVHPFYFRTGVPDDNEQFVRFRGIAALADGEYYVTRNGPDTNPQKFGGPDDALLIFNKEDVFLTPMAIVTEIGTFRNFFRQPQGLATFAQPPQSPVIDQGKDFYFTSISPTNALKVQRIVEVIGPFGSNFEVGAFQTGDTSLSDRFLLEGFRFDKPVDVTVAGDGTNYFWVVDEARDSVYQFTGRGFEGVNPPPGSSSDKVIRVSFGGKGIGLTQFNKPRAVAYIDQILYVADGGNGRILRFKLTTDFD
ncbi:MAG: hypothetical protein AAFY71_01735 [Bacteroidota bacterium]